MTNVKIAFKFLDDDIPPSPGYKQIHCFVIFDVKMDFVSGGHLTNHPTSMIYTSVVNIESVRFAFPLAALHNLEILAGDIGNAYLNAITTEKTYYRAGNEWGPMIKGRVLVVVWPLYGLKTSTNAWHTHICNTLQSKMKFKSILADNDV